MPAGEAGARSAARQKHAGLLSHGPAGMAQDFRHNIVAISPRAVYADETHPNERNHVTDINTAKDRLRAAISAGGYLDGVADDIEIVLEALDELENSYVPHLPAETDTWLGDHQDFKLMHPLPPSAKVLFHYGPGRDQYLIAHTTDDGLLIQAPRGTITIAPRVQNAVTITGSVK